MSCKDGGIALVRFPHSDMSAVETFPTALVADYYPDLEPEDIRACIQYAIDVLAVEDIRLAPSP
jgi:hypothetical protein